MFSLTSSSTEPQQSKAIASLLFSMCVFRRHIKNESFWEALVARARELNTTREVLGGNAPVMALRMLREGCDVLLGATSSAQLMTMMDKGIRGAIHFESCCRIFLI